MLAIDPASLVGRRAPPPGGRAMDCVAAVALRGSCSTGPSRAEALAHLWAQSILHSSHTSRGGRACANSGAKKPAGEGGLEATLVPRNQDYWMVPESRRQLNVVARGKADDGGRPISATAGLNRYPARW
jgi:hypothetical protein